MKSFEEIVDTLWKPTSFRDWLYECVPARPITRLDFYRSNSPTNKLIVSFIDRMYKYSGEVIEPFYGKDINEPVIKICKRILSRPDRFYLEYNSYSEVKRTEGRCIKTYAVLDKLVVVDKDTNQKFTIKGYTLKSLTCLTKDENKLLVVTLLEWYSFMKDTEDKKRVVKEQKRKDKFRQELTDLYKDL